VCVLGCEDVCCSRVEEPPGEVSGAGVGVRVCGSGLSDAQVLQVWPLCMRASET